jgi:hypothetical protein
MPDRVRLRDSLIPETARLIRDQQSLRRGLTLRTRHRVAGAGSFGHMWEIMQTHTYLICRRECPNQGQVQRPKFTP